MKNINRVTLMGHIVADPEEKKTLSGKSISTFAIATNNEWLDEQGVLQKSVDFHRLVAWESMSNLVSQYIKKGTPVFLEGRLTNRAYESADKVRRFVTEVVVQSLHILRFQENKFSSQNLEENKSNMMVSA